MYNLVDVIFPPQQRIAVVKKFEKKIQEQAKENMILGGGDKKLQEYKNRVSPNGEKRNGSKIHTDKELAKMAGVGTGNIARFNKVMNSNDIRCRIFQYRLIRPSLPIPFLRMAA